MVTPVSITHQFNGDAAAADLVDAADLDTALGNLATTINSEIAERQRTIRDGSGLAAQVVRYPSLHPEITALLTAGGLVPLQSAAVAALTNQAALSGLLTIDGYTLLAADRVLLVGQTNPLQNGLWVAAAGAWSRPTDSASGSALAIYTEVNIISGTTQSGSVWMLKAAATVDSTGQSWILFSGYGTVIPLTRGGTGATTAPAALTNLGLSAYGQSLVAAVSAAAALILLGIPTSPTLESIATRTLIGRTVAGTGVASAVSPDDVKVISDGSVTARDFSERFAEITDVKDFGAIGNGVADDTTAIAAAIAAAGAGTLILPAGSYKITAPLVISGTGLNIIGEGSLNSILVASGNFDAIVQCGATAAEVKFRQVSFVQTGTTTKCLNLQSGSQVISFWDCSFSGNGALSLVFSQSAGYCTFGQCRWDCNGASTVGLQLDMFNQNTRIYGGSRFGGIGLGCSITKSGGSARVEGTCFSNVQFINTGTYQINIGNSLLTQVIGCNLDQAGTYCITVANSADQVQIVGNWLGMAAGTGICVNFDSTSGGGHVVANNIFNLGATSLNMSATAGVRIDSILIDGNTFAGATSTTLQLDSVKNCRVVNNRDTSTAATNGSWYSVNNAALAGSYFFDNNQWATNVTAPVLFDATSTYRFGNDTGMVGNNKGTSTSGGGATTLVINHGVFRTPSNILVTPATNVGAFFINTIGATQFTITWATAAAATWHWKAEV